VTRLRFLLDDATQCKTQQVILSVFATDLEKGELVEVVLSSRLPELRRWSDAPPESSKRLGLRLQALQPEPNLWTVFLPGHIVPGSIASASRWEGALGTREFTTVADLDLFAVNNTHPDCQQFHDFASVHQDYESISSYNNLSATDIPAWLVSGGLISARQLTQRPWYSAFAPTRLQWLGWAKKAMDRGLLNLAIVEEDIRTGQVRPSLLEDLKGLHLVIDVTPLPDLTLDALFMAPERRLTDIQHRLLHSAELQKRTAQYARRNATSKLSKLGLLRYLWHYLRRLPKLGFNAAYFVYSRTLRPAVKRLRQQPGTRE
jgi:hypothetical protein